MGLWKDTSTVTAGSPQKVSECYTYNGMGIQVHRMELRSEEDWFVSWPKYDIRGIKLNSHLLDGAKTEALIYCFNLLQDDVLRLRSAILADKDEGDECEYED